VAEVGEDKQIEHEIATVERTNGISHPTTLHTLLETRLNLRVDGGNSH
jgi:hypothetical protein